MPAAQSQMPHDHPFNRWAASPSDQLTRSDPSFLPSASILQPMCETVRRAAAAAGIGLSNAIPQGRVAVAPGSDVSPPRGDPAAAHDPLPPARVSSDAEYHSVSGDLERAFADEVTAGWFRPRPLFEGSVGQCYPWGA